MYTFIIHLSDVSTKYVLQRMYCAVAFFVKLQTTIRHLIRETISWAFFLDDVIVGNDINQVYGEKRGINVQDKAQHASVS